MSGLLVWAVGIVLVTAVGIARDRRMFASDPDTVYWVALTWPISLPCLAGSAVVAWCAEVG